MNKKITTKIGIIRIDTEAEIKLGDLHINVDTTIDGHREFNIYIATQVKLNFIENMKKNNSILKFYKVISIAGIIDENNTEV